MLRRLYDWTIRIANHRHALLGLFGISFAESSVFPVPPDVLLIPMVVTRRDQAFRIAAVCTLGSVLGGMLGYGIGHFLFEQIGEPLLAFYGATEAFERFRGLYNEWGAWIVAMAAVTFVPYKVVTIASGVFGLDFFTFVLVSAAARGTRFFVEAALLRWIGPPVQRFVERNLALTATLAFAVLFAVFLIARKVISG